MIRRIDLAGHVYNQLTVIEFAGKTGKKVQWKCRCSCGNETLVSSAGLRSGHTKSCGCLQRRVCKEFLTTHGGSYTPEHRSWSCMKDRCINPKNPSYHNYGGRGIKVCDRWLNSFENFLADMGVRPTKTHSLGRYPNINGDYNSSNCRWETPSQQGESRRTNLWIKYKGEDMILAAFQREIGTKSMHVLALLKTKTPEQIAIYYKNKKNGLVKN